VFKGLTKKYVVFPTLNFIGHQRRQVLSDYHNERLVSGNIIVMASYC